VGGVEYFVSRLLLTLIHPTAQNRISATFAFIGFSEVRLNGVLRSSALLGILLRFCIIGYIHFPTREYAVFVTWQEDAS
jgi:hypothetical protein